MLYIIPSPIGNLADFTFRALEVLQSVDVILAEDTRTSLVLLNHYAIQKPLSPYHQHNEHKVTAHLVAQMQNGKTMALITDALIVKAKNRSVKNKFFKSKNIYGINKKAKALR